MVNSDPDYCLQKESLLDAGIAGFFLPVSLISGLPGIALNFILYSRSNCPLCEAMEDELRPFIEEYSITVNRQYIDNEVALQALYGDKIPVLSLNDEIICHYFLDTEILLKAITDTDR